MPLDAASPPEIRAHHHVLLEDLSMLQTIEVEIDTRDRIHPVKPFEHLPSGPAHLTFLTPVEQVAGTALLAEPTLAEDCSNRRRMWHGDLCSRTGSDPALSVFRTDGAQVSARALAGGCRQGRLDRVSDHPQPNFHTRMQVT